jgi:hypothetical protein
MAHGTSRIVMEVFQSVRPGPQSSSEHVFPSKSIGCSWNILEATFKKKQKASGLELE